MQAQGLGGVRPAREVVGSSGLEGEGEGGCPQERKQGGRGLVSQTARLLFKKGRQE
jgi:hypothetical protein